jgi:hypothetical protein
MAPPYQPSDYIYDSADDTIPPPLPQVPLETHEPGINDTASGILPPSTAPHKTTVDPEALSISDNDATVCNDDLRDLLAHMPHTLFTLPTLVSYNVFQHPNTCTDYLPQNFHTTISGLRRAVARTYDGDGTTMHTDEQLAVQLKRVGGVPRDEGAYVVYPEELVPVEGVEEGNLDWGWWSEVLGLGKVWREQERGEWETVMAREREEVAEFLRKRESNVEQVFMPLPGDWDDYLE